MFDLIDKKIVLFDKGVSIKLFLLEQQAVKDEMKRRGVRFFPKQVITRIVAAMTINPLTMTYN